MPAAFRTAAARAPRHHVATIRRAARPRRTSRELGPNGIALRMIAGATGRPGVSVLLGAAL